MSFQNNLDSIRIKTGMGLTDFRRLAARKGFTDGETIKTGVKAGEVVYWLNKDFNLEHHTSLAIYAYLKGQN